MAAALRLAPSLTGAQLRDLLSDVNLLFLVDVTQEVE